MAWSGQTVAAAARPVGRPVRPQPLISNSELGRPVLLEMLLYSPNDALHIIVEVRVTSNMRTLSKRKGLK